ncbi:MAG: phage tail protein [Armatimonadetes bacterium]|nr:phage tail protein [Armatimonadota bacterium]
MFDSSADLAPTPPPKPLGRDTALLASEEHGRIVPYLAGRRRLGLTWISDAWGVSSQPVKRKVGKKRETVGHNYYASFAGVLGVGPLTTLHAIYVEEEKVWEGPLTASGDYADLTIEGRGPLRLYWGTETQTVDANLADSGVQHPAYRGQAYVVFDNWLLGENRSQVPQIEFDVTRLPADSALSVPAALNGEAHPLAVLEELLTHPRFGAGLPADLLYLPSWNAAADQLAEEGFSVSVRLVSATRLDALLTDFLDYVDAALIQTAAGKLALRLLREAGTPVALAAADLTEPPALTAHGWPETVNEINLRFANRARAWQTDAVVVRDPASYAVTRRPLTQEIEADWITDQAVAWKVAAGMARARALPWLDGTVRVLRRVGADLRPGDLVDLTYPTQGLDAVRFRVLGVETPGPAAAEVVLQVREDTSQLLGTGYTVPADVVGGASAYEPQPPHSVLALELPWAWKRSDQHWLLVLPARGNTLDNRFTVHWERKTDSYAVAVEGVVWGLRGTLNAPLSGAGLIYHPGGLDVTFTSPDNDIEDMPFSEGVEARKFVIFIGNEIMYGFDPVLTAPGRYTISIMRGQVGTRRGGHSAGAAVWCVQLGQQELAVWEAPKSYKAVNLKVQAHLLQREVPLADITPTSLSITRRGLRPLGPANLTARGDGVAPTWTGSESITFTWTLTSDDRAETDPTVNLTSRAERCILEFWAGGVLKKTWTVDEDPPRTASNADLLEWLGGAVTFTVRAYLARGGYRSVDYDEITVTKV